MKIPYKRKIPTRTSRGLTWENKRAQAKKRINFFVIFQQTPHKMSHMEIYDSFRLTVLSTLPSHKHWYCSVVFVVVPDVLHYKSSLFPYQVISGKNIIDDSTVLDRSFYIACPKALENRRWTSSRTGAFPFAFLSTAIKINMLLGKGKKSGTMI